MLVNLSDILSQDGKEMQIQATLEMDRFHTFDGDYEFAEKQPVELHLTNQGKKQLLVEAKTDLSIWIPCARCLDPVKTSFHIRCEYEIDMSQSEEDRIENLDENNFIEENNLDVEQLIYNEILIRWPMRVLCKDDCQGICSHCGKNLNKGTCNCETRELDPRMAAISDIFSKFKEV